MEKPINSIINLDSLLDFSDRLNQTYDRRFILNSTLLSLMGKLKIFKASALLFERYDKFKIELVKGRLDVDGKDISDSEPFYFDDYDKAEKFLKDAAYKYFIPVIYKDETKAVICLGEKVRDGELTEEEQRYAGLVCNIAANALENARNKKHLDQEKMRVEQRRQLLNTLFEVGRCFSSLLSREQIIKMLANYMMGQLTVNRFAVMLYYDDDKFEIINNSFSKEPDEELLAELKNIESTGSVDDFELSFQLREFLGSINAKFLSPMKVQGETKGFMLVGRKLTGEEFDEGNIQFIESLGNIAISALENERLFKEAVEKKRMESEMSLALEIQKNLLPKVMPDLQGFQIDGITYPSRTVGGDYFDLIKLSENELMIAIADVSGKGVPAALLMANMQASLRLLAPLKLSLTEMILRINNLIYQNTTADKFVTFFCGILDTSLNKFRYVNAGHNPPLYLKISGEMHDLEEGGLIIGYTDEPFPYESGEIGLESGETVLLYTDGITEAQNNEKEEYELERLKAKFIENARSSASEIMTQIINDVRQFSLNTAQFDDITCIVLKKSE